MRERSAYGGPDLEAERIATQVVDSAVEVRRVLGAGLPERAYQISLARELERRGIQARLEVSLPIAYKGAPLGISCRPDIVAGDKVLVEAKAVETLLPVHRAQTLSYLHLSPCPIAFLINFGGIPIAIKRFVDWPKRPR